MRTLALADYPQVLALNSAFERFLSPMDEARLQHLHRQSAYARVVVRGSAVAAFILAFREGADYDSPNFVWFDERYPSFLYIDRVVVAAEYQGRKLGSKLYGDLFTFASGTGVPSVVCEFDLQPPNEASRRFHLGFGFSEVGTQWLAGGTKEVSLQRASVSNDRGA